MVVGALINFIYLVAVNELVQNIRHKRELLLNT